jgi:DNA repair exonuclease SbcCD ATPase subunit
MTLLGKFLAMLIFILSAAFMVLALAVNASHRNWRDVVLAPNTGLKARVEVASRTNEQLRADAQRTRAALDREQAARRTALAALQTQLDQIDQVLRASEASVQQLEAKNTELSQLDRSRAEELQRLTEETRKLREQIRSEQEDRDTLFAETLQMTDQMNRLRGIVQQQSERNEQLLAQVSRYREVVEMKGIDINEPLDGSPPDRNGTILVVDRPRNLVEVSIGFDDGLRDGHLLDITRRGQYIGKLKIRRTEPNRAVAEILKDYETAIIQEGDRVDTSY